MRTWTADPCPAADPIVCAGRAVDDHGQHVGPPCERRFTPHGRYAPAVEQARAAGWAIGTTSDGQQTATCPRCRRPDPTIAKGLTE